MLRRHSIPLLAAILVAGIAAPFNTPFVIVALLPLYPIAKRDLWHGVAAGAVIALAQLAKLDEPIELAASVVLAGAVIVGARFMVLRSESAARERELLSEAAATEERLRIARELHDAVGHDVSLMVVQAEALAAVTGDERADAIAALGRRTMGEMHRTLNVLRETADRTPQHGLADLGNVIEGARGAGVPITFTVEGTPRALPAALDASAYRIVQEAVTNVIRHAGGAAAAVTVRYGDDRLELRVTDEGASGASGGRDGDGGRDGGGKRGHDGRDGGGRHSGDGGRDGGGRHGVHDGRGGDWRGGGHGLVGMRERVAAFGGTLDAGPRAGRGFAVRADLPLPPRDHDGPPR